ncbi:transcription-repair coupling factor [Amnibacterium sp. CER49]|uniref:transcription-repair coupling factor n=1 Tax=Amnibacterium sp. CER49 TaxID=3039161 RepID=UPI00244BCFF4|nr:transcription-repair coupling factor [Amnibacterium sp. CER49]MDH2445440.1 transcription-repair coupling factor [Amnibacterium sp. CER49]
MSLGGLPRLLSHGESVERALVAASRNADFSATPGLHAPLLAALLERRRDRGEADAAFLITATEREADALRASFECLVPHAELLDLPAWETLPHERLSPGVETVGRRLHAIRRMALWRQGDAPLIVVAPVRAALQPLTAGLAEIEPIAVALGQRGVDLNAVGARLVELAYTRVDLVTRRGEFAVRGGILDVFSPVAEHPVRIDFFGDEVDQLRHFSVADQRSLDAPVDRVELVPARELLLTPSVQQRARELRHEFPNLATMLAKIAEGIPVEGMESLAPALADGLVSIAEYLPRGSAVAVVSPERVASRAVSLADTNREFLHAAWNAATAGAQAPIDLEAGDFLTVNALREQAGADHTWWTLSSFEAQPDDPELDPAKAAALLADSAEYLRVAGAATPVVPGRPAELLDHVGSRLRHGWSVVVTAAGKGLVERAHDVLAERGLAARQVDALPDELEPGIAYVTLGDVDAGFEQPEISLALVTEREFYGRAASVDARAPRKLASRRKNVVDPLQLKAGDYVVHQTHGIGRFVELVRREVAGQQRTGPRRMGEKAPEKVVREFLLLEYAPSKRGYPGDKLYVPTDQLDLLTRYVGGEAPQLSKMGGADWAAAKGRARKAVRDIAVELVKLYSARMASRGHAFGPDTPWQRELEEAFPFAETPDQLETIEQVKADMERPIPMDRLVSGDVGFGKTEVAVRAAFKAIQDGKQVAMLVPTTLLVRQHLETFQERFAGFPVNVRPLSRFQSDKEARETIKGIGDGTVDLVIGTHRILSNGLVFKDLGLVIIDEEQRFGVEHKDQLKKLKTNVDVLAMSATPIPRTLEMAVTGIREMSTLATPPEDRHPILTYVGARSSGQITAAIRRELLREGQVFYVHNQVQSIQRVAAEIAELVPEARIAVAHGQMGEHQLEQVMVDFWERRFDVLVSTTIIETGLDIANANTLIVDRADKYGLSQLHQLRGRVGRGRERGYAYFLYEAEKPLSETAVDRLETIAANNDLGAGMQVALKDLEIRGAGNLLGGEQSGHIQGVGFDLYLRMIGEAVADFRGEVAEGQTELRLELPVDARIPESYIDSERLRLEAYQKLSAASAPAAQDGQIDLVLDELVDRYGPAPDEVTNLIRVSKLRRVAQQAGLSDVVSLGRMLRVAPADLPDSMQVRLQRMYPGSKVLASAGAVTVPMPTLDGQPLPDAGLVEWVHQLLTAVFAKQPQPTA